MDGPPNIGIWRGVRLEGRRRPVLHDLRLDIVRLDGRVGVEMETVVENLSAMRVRDCALELEIHPPEGGAPLRRRYPVEVPPGGMPLRDLIEIPTATLWWPNGMGDQPLCRIVARVSDIAGSVVYDQRELSLGLRMIEVDRRRLPGPANDDGHRCIPTSHPRSGNLQPSTDTTSPRQWCPCRRTHQLSLVDSCPPRALGARTDWKPGLLCIRHHHPQVKGIGFPGSGPPAGDAAVHALAAQAGLHRYGRGELPDGFAWSPE